MLRIFDMNGRLVVENRLYKLEDATFLQVGLLDLTPGLYIITVESEGGVQSDKIFIP
jgi:hypothetical protein